MAGVSESSQTRIDLEQLPELSDLLHLRQDDRSKYALQTQFSESLRDERDRQNGLPVLLALDVPDAGWNGPMMRRISQKHVLIRFSASAKVVQDYAVKWNSDRRKVSRGGHQVVLFEQL